MDTWGVEAGKDHGDSRDTGTCQERADRRERDDSDYEREAEYGDVAGNMVPGVPGGEALTEDSGDDARREDVKRGWEREEEHHGELIIDPGWLGSGCRYPLSKWIGLYTQQRGC